MALENDPRRIQDAADIQALIEHAGDALELELLRDYYGVFGRERDLERLLARSRRR